MDDLKKRMKQIMSDWNGDYYGRHEDRVNIARKILDKIEEIEELLQSLYEI